MTWLLKLYPRDWRRRYGAEIEELVAAQPRSLQLVVDLLGGAVDAHLKPQAFARRLDGATATGGGGWDMLNRMKCCAASRSMSRKEALFAAGLTIASALVIAAIMLVGDNQMTRTIGLTMFPGVLAVGTQTMYLRGHSTAAKVVLVGGLFLVLFLIGLLAALIQAA